MRSREQPHMESTKYRDFQNPKPKTQVFPTDRENVMKKKFLKLKKKYSTFRWGFTFWILLLGFYYFLLLEFVVRFCVGAFPRPNAWVPILKTQNSKPKPPALVFGFQGKMCEFKTQNPKTFERADVEHVGFIWDIFYIFKTEICGHIQCTFSLSSKLSFFIFFFSEIKKTKTICVADHFYSFINVISFPGGII